MRAPPSEQTHLITQDDSNEENKTRMKVTMTTWAVALAGVVIMGILWVAQIIAFVRPYDEWTIVNIYTGNPPKNLTEYFAYNQGWALADTFFSCPLQMLASVAMLRGRKWGFLLGVAVAVAPFYSALDIFVWDHDTGARQNTFVYWVFIWGMFPAFGIVEGV